MKAAKSQTMLPVAGTDMLLPVTELTGAKEGETITLSAGVHSREYAGVQALTELAQELDPRQVRGTIRLLHCCNYEGFLRRSADVVPQDGKNLNREFPRRPWGNPHPAAGRLFGAGVYRTHRLPGGFALRRLLRKPDAPSLLPRHRRPGGAGGFPGGWRSSPRCPTWWNPRRKTAFTAGRDNGACQPFCWSGGGCGLVEPAAIKGHKRDALRLLRGLGFLEDGEPVPPAAHQVITTAFYENAPESGCWCPAKAAGDFIREGEALGEIRNLFGKVLRRVTAKVSGGHPLPDGFPGH